MASYNLTGAVSALVDNLSYQAAALIAQPHDLSKHALVIFFSNLVNEIPRYNFIVVVATLVSNETLESTQLG